MALSSFKSDYSLSELLNDSRLLDSDEELFGLYDWPALNYSMLLLALALNLLSVESCPPVGYFWKLKFEK